MTTLFNKLWQYNDWANQSLMQSMAQQEEALPYKSLHLLSHITNAQHIWIARINGISPSIGVWEDHDLVTCKELHQTSSAQIKEEIENPEADQQRTIQYKNSRGQHFENQVDNILLHLFNHGTYHRGQIAQDLRANDITPIGTDYILFCQVL